MPSNRTILPTLCLLAACATPPSQPDPPSITEAFEPETIGLVHLDTKFFVVADEAGEYFSVTPRADSPTFGGKIVVEVVAVHDAWVEVRSTDQRDVCAHFDLAGPGLHFFVSPDAFVPVLREVVALDFPDGTGGELVPGLALRPDEEVEGRYEVRHLDLVFSVDLPETAVGLSFEPSMEFSILPGVYGVPHGGLLQLNGRPVTTSPARGPNGTWVDRPAPDLVELTRPCARLVVSKDPGQEPSEQEILWPHGICGFATNLAYPRQWGTYDLPAEAPLYWMDGSVAGSLPARTLWAADGLQFLGEYYCRTGDLIERTGDLREAMELDSLGWCVHRDDVTYEPGEPLFPSR